MTDVKTSRQCSGAAGSAIRNRDLERQLARRIKCAGRVDRLADDVVELESRALDVVDDEDSLCRIGAHPVTVLREAVNRLGSGRGVRLRVSCGHAAPYRRFAEAEAAT